MPIISSRTPEGEPHQCPVCQQRIVVDPSEPFGDAPCPACGTLLWFVGPPEQRRYWDAADERTERLLDRLAEHFGLTRGELTARTWSSDSLDIVELIMTIEELDD